jgi:hypothetical protein
MISICNKVSTKRCFVKHYEENVPLEETISEKKISFPFKNKHSFVQNSFVTLASFDHLTRLMTRECFVAY